MTSEGRELPGEGVVRLRIGEFDLLRQVVREVRELSDAQLSELGVRRDEVDDLRTAVRAVHGELAGTGCTALDVVLDEAPAGAPSVTRPPEAAPRGAGTGGVGTGGAGTARVTGMLGRATAVRLPDMIHYVRGWLGDVELGHRTGSDPGRLNDLADRFRAAGRDR